MAINALVEPHREVHLIASNLRFATPHELCGLRALLDYAAIQADSVIFDCPYFADVHSYLARMDFYADLPSNVVLSRDAPILHRQDRRTNLIELHRLRDADDVEDLMDRVEVVAREQFGAGPLANACATAIGAASENVIDHAQSPIGALVAAQRYRSTGLELCVVDIGLGIPVTLRSNPDFAALSEVDAVETAIRDGVTSTGEPGRGAGLAELASRIRDVGGATLSIQSSLASVTWSWQRDRERVLRQEPSCSTPGTWITVRLQPRPRPHKED